VLQWGRGCVATEIPITPNMLLFCRNASMGPWLCSHGNESKARPPRDPVDASMGPWLCSHGNIVIRPNCKIVWPLQWGRGCVATEIGIDWLAITLTPAASMGPWLCSHGNEGCYASVVVQRAGFNGAVAV